MKPDSVPTIFPQQNQSQCALKAEPEYASEVNNENMAEMSDSEDEKFTFEVLPHVVTPKDEPEFISPQEIDEDLQKWASEGGFCIEYTQPLELHEFDVKPDPEPEPEPDFKKLYLDLRIQYAELKNSIMLEIDKNSSDHSLTKIFHQKFTFSIENFKNYDSKILYYTGFKNYKIFRKSLEVLCDNATDKIKIKYMNNSHQNKLNIEDEYFLVLVKLNQNFDYEHLSHLFDIPLDTVSDIFLSWINAMYIKLGNMDIWLHRNILLASNNKNNVLASLYSTQFSIEALHQLSDLKTLKGLLVIDNNGGILFVSSLFTWAISDDQLLSASGLLDKITHKLKKGVLKSGDSFKADRNYTAKELIENVVDIKIPDFIIPCFDPDEEFSGISGNMDGVEKRVLSLSKFKILQDQVPEALLGNFNQIWTVCCLLSNFGMAAS